MTNVLLYYLIVINIVTFLVYGIDKWKAKQGSWRISEATLLILAVIGGSIGALLDEGCLKAVFKVYQMDYPDYRFYDTLTAARRQFGHSLPNHQLHTVAAACGYDLHNHHHALADAEACAAIALYII